MITHKLSNTVFFSNQLAEKKEFKPFWKLLQKALKDKVIEPRQISGTRKLRIFRETIESIGLKIKAVIPDKDYERNFYINYFQIGKLIFLPAFNTKKLDDKAISDFQELFGHENVVPVPSKEIAKYEGVLN